MACGLNNNRNVKKNVLQCHCEQTFSYKIISQHQCDTASEICSSYVLTDNVNNLYMITSYLLKKH